MENDVIPCRLRLQVIPHGSDEKATSDYVQEQVDSKGWLDIPVETRLMWAEKVTKAFISIPKKHESIRPVDIVFKEDGSAEFLHTHNAKTASTYPARYCIPVKRLQDLDQVSVVRRAESFALGSLLYEIMAGKRPFDELSDEEVQNKYNINEFPDTSSLRLSSLIILCWKGDFFDHAERLRK